MNNRELKRFVLIGVNKVHINDSKFQILKDKTGLIFGSSTTGKGTTKENLNKLNKGKL